MYGTLHAILKDLVLKTAGAPAWRKILSEAGLAADEESILDGVPLGDDVTFSLFSAACKVLDLTMEKALYSLGRHFINFALRSGCGAFLKSQGATFPDFLGSIHDLHSSIERMHPLARFPMLAAAAEASNNSNDNAGNSVADSMTFTYLSTRQGLKSLVVGIMEEIGLRLYGVDVVFEELHEVPEEMKQAASGNRAAMWRVTWTARPGGPEPLPKDPEVRKVPFPALHSSMAELMAVLRRKPCTIAKLVAATPHSRAQPGMVRRAPAPKRLSGSCGPPKRLSGSSGPPKRPSGGAASCRVSVGSNSSYQAASNSANSSEASSPREFSRSASRRKWDCVRRSSKDAGGMDFILLRTVPARVVGAAWSDPDLPRVRDFWSSSVGRAEDYELSRDDTRIDVFVSHSWSAPTDWDELMGSDNSYEEIKSSLVAVMAKDIAVLDGKIHEWGSVRMWVDKACIVQDIAELKGLCITLIDRFIRHSDHVCVIFTWSYLERLWCVYEWASILADKDPKNVYLQNEFLVTERTMPLYLQSVRQFSLVDTKCFVESDRALLWAKIEEHYVSGEAFETLVKATAIALMARSMTFRAGYSDELRDKFFTPWVSLAEELGFHELAKALSTCRASEWRSGKLGGLPRLVGAGAVNTDVLNGVSATRSISKSLMSPNGASCVSITRYHTLINTWFDLTVVPVLSKIRAAVVFKEMTEDLSELEEIFN